MDKNNYIRIEKWSRGLCAVRWIDGCTPYRMTGFYGNDRNGKRSLFKHLVQERGFKACNITWEK